MNRAGDRVVVFVSRGGTCRDPMAKAITQALLAREAPTDRIRLETGALDPPSKATASSAARRAIETMFGEDLLADHRPARLTRELIEDADLILVMSESMRQSGLLPPEKTDLLTVFFGSEGDIADPWPDGDDPETNARYYRCAERIRSVIEPNIGRLIDFAERR
jgi:protein-tyrosine-phosphatase